VKDFSFYMNNLLDDAEFGDTIDTNLRLDFTSGVVGRALELVTDVLSGGLLRVGL
jgi:hypothetical protein